MIIEDVGKAPFYKFRNVSKFVSTYLKTGVDTSYRYFDEGYWFVHQEFLSRVVTIARSKSVVVDYHTLPDDIQILIASKRSTSNYTKSTQSYGDAYSALHILPTAPEYVIKAVYRAMAKKHHPDQGGEAEEFRRITEAYKELVK